MRVARSRKLSMLFGMEYHKDNYDWNGSTGIGTMNYITFVAAIRNDIGLPLYGKRSFSFSEVNELGCC